MRGCLGFALVVVERGGIAEIIGGEVVLALLAAADAPSHPAHGGLGLPADGFAKPVLRSWCFAGLVGLHAGIVQLAVAQLGVGYALGLLPVGVGEGVPIEQGTGEVGLAKIAAPEQGTP